jgi:hypothetical protein
MDKTDPVSETLCFLVSRIPDNGQNIQFPKLRVFKFLEYRTMNKTNPVSETSCFLVSRIPDGEQNRSSFRNVVFSSF